MTLVIGGKPVEAKASLRTLPQEYADYRYQECVEHLKLRFKYERIAARQRAWLQVHEGTHEQVMKLAWNEDWMKHHHTWFSSQTQKLQSILERWHDEERALWLAERGLGWPVWSDEDGDTVPDTWARVAPF
jgi:hypothetical protein